MSGMTWKPDVTVAAIAERDGKFLFVEERSGGRVVMWKIPAMMPTMPAAMWWATMPPGLKGLKPSGPQEG